MIFLTNIFQDPILRISKHWLNKGIMILLHFRQSSINLLLSKTLTTTLNKVRWTSIIKSTTFLYLLTSPFLRDQLRTPQIVVNPSMLQNMTQTTIIPMIMSLPYLQLLQLCLFQLLQELLEALSNLPSPNQISITLSQTSMNSYLFINPFFFFFCLKVSLYITI